MFVPHGIFDILTFDHRRGVGLAPCGAGLLACAQLSSDACWRMARFKIGGMAAMSSLLRLARVGQGMA